MVAIRENPAAPHVCSLTTVNIWQRPGTSAQRVVGEQRGRHGVTTLLKGTVVFIQPRHGDGSAVPGPVESSSPLPSGADCCRRPYFICRRARHAGPFLYPQTIAPGESAPAQRFSRPPGPSALPCRFFTFWSELSSGAESRSDVVISGFAFAAR